MGGPPPPTNPPKIGRIRLSLAKTDPSPGITKCFFLMFPHGYVIDIKCPQTFSLIDQLLQTYSKDNIINFNLIRNIQ